jgi:Tol biopolymer transport system component
MKKIVGILIMIICLVAASSSFALVKQLSHFNTPFGFNYSPSLTSDGKTLYFCSSFNLTGNNPQQLSQIFRIDVAIGTTSQISSFSEEYNLRELKVSGNGSVIIFTAANNQYLNIPSLYIINSDGTGLVRLTTETEYVNSISTSFNGDIVIFASSPLSAQINVYSINRNGSGRQMILKGESYQGTIYAQVSGNGQKVLIATPDNFNRPLQLYVINTNGTGLKQLTNDESIVWYGGLIPPSSFDGDNSLFISSYDYSQNKPGQSLNLFRIKTDGSAPVQIAASYDYPCENGIYCTPTSNLISGDGLKVVYQQPWRINSQGAQAQALVRRNADGTNAVNLLDLPQTDFGGDLLAIDQGASVVVFASQDDYTGQNQNHNREFFAYIDETNSHDFHLPLRPIPNYDDIKNPITLDFDQDVSWADKPHNGIDYKSGLGGKILSVGNGIIYSYTKPYAERFGSINPNGKGPAIWVRYKLKTGEPIYVLYGHTSTTSNDNSRIKVKKEKFVFDCSYTIKWKTGNFIATGEEVGMTAHFYRGGVLTPHLHFSVFKPKMKDGSYDTPPNKGWGYSDIEKGSGEYIDPEIFFREYYLAEEID